MPEIYDLGLYPTIARTLVTGASSAGVTLTGQCRRISVLAVTANCLFKIGQGAQTATASDHFLLAGERLILQIPKNSSIAAIRHASTTGTLEITEFA